MSEHEINEVARFAQVIAESGYARGNPDTFSEEERVAMAWLAKEVGLPIAAEVRREWADQRTRLLDYIECLEIHLEQSEREDEKREAGILPGDLDRDS